MACPHCHGDGCQRCFNSGNYPVTRCPQLEVTDDVRDACEAAEFARKGSWPLAGGTLDQTAVFLNACRIVWAEEDANRNETSDPILQLIRGMVS